MTTKLSEYVITILFTLLFSWVRVYDISFIQLFGVNKCAIKQGRKFVSVVWVNFLSTLSNVEPTSNFKDTCPFKTIILSVFCAFRFFLQQWLPAVATIPADKVTAQHMCRNAAWEPPAAPTSPSPTTPTPTRTPRQTPASGLVLGRRQMRARAARTNATIINHLPPNRNNSNCSSSGSSSSNGQAGQVCSLAHGWAQWPPIDCWQSAS